MCCLGLISEAVYQKYIELFKFSFHTIVVDLAHDSEVKFVAK